MADAGFLKIIDATQKLYMNIDTGSVDEYGGWWYEGPDGNWVNGVDEGEAIEVSKDAGGSWIAR